MWKPSPYFFLIAPLNDGSDIKITLVGNDAFRVVAELLLGGLDILLDMPEQSFPNA